MAKVWLEDQEYIIKDPKTFSAYIKHHLKFQPDIIAAQPYYKTHDWKGFIIEIETEPTEDKTRRKHEQYEDLHQEGWTIAVLRAPLIFPFEADLRNKTIGDIWNWLEISLKEAH
jgi:hypothetical protein